MTNYNGKIWGAKMNVGTDESFLKLKFSQEITTNGEKCDWLKQMRPNLAKKLLIMVKNVAG